MSFVKIIYFKTVRMKKKITILILAVICLPGFKSKAQCPQPPLYSIATHCTVSGWTFAFTIPQPACDSILGWQVQWRILGTSTWSEVRADSLKQVNGEGLWGGRLETSLTAGSHYQWRDRMIMYRPNGSSVYSSWVYGNSFIPINPPAGYNTPPDFMEMFLPGATDLLTIVGANPEAGWTNPTTYQLQYKPVTATTWQLITGPAPNPIPGAIAPYITGLTPSTNYQWRMRYKCGTNGYSVWVKGPNFTTAAGSFAKGKNLPMSRKILNFTPQQISTYTDEEATVISIAGTGISIYPNPVNTQFTIKSVGIYSGKITATLTDVNGIVQWKNVIDAMQLNGYKVDAAKLASGIYTLQVIDEKGNIHTAKVLISR